LLRVWNVAPDPNNLKPTVYQCVVSAGEQHALQSWR
jgi:hypothetical protein